MMKERTILSDYDLPDLYDLRIGGRGDDVEGFLSIAQQTGGPILELGCGTGRVCIPLALAGHEVTGVDLSPSMLSRARQKAKERGAGSLELHEADMSDFQFDKKFRLAIIPDNALHELISLEDKQRCFSCVLRHLAPGGTLVMDFCPPPTRRSCLPNLEKELIREFYSPERKAKVKCYVTVTINPGTQISEGQMLYKLLHDSGEESEIVSPFKGAFVTQGELELLLEAAGFNTIEFHGDFGGSAFTPESSRMVVTARAPS